jgi:hypothetical protein
MTPLPCLAVALSVLASCTPPTDDGAPTADFDLARVPHPHGIWVNLPYTAPHNPIHAAVLHTKMTSAMKAHPAVLGEGKVFILSGSGDDMTQMDYTADVLDVATGTFDTSYMTYDGFCGGLSQGAWGDVFVTGGTIYDNVQDKGLPDVSNFDVQTGTFQHRASMAHGRWYDTVTLLGDGRFMVDGGWDQTAMNSTVEIFTPGSGWSREYDMGFEPEFYPRQHLMRDGRVFKSGPETESLIFDPAVVSATNTGWTHAEWTHYGGNAQEIDRQYGTSVLLGLYPDDDYDAQVLIMGGNMDYPTNTTEHIDLDASTPQWVPGPNMAHKRTQMNAVILPDGTVLALGGVTDTAESPGDEDMAYAVMSAELYHPDTDTFTAAGRYHYPKVYHAVALLLPDATVWAAGTQYGMGTFEDHIELYKPAYLFDSTGARATRPVILSVSDHHVQYGQAFDVDADTNDVDAMVFVRPGTVTHAFNTDQRLVGLEFTTRTGTGKFTATAPPDSGLAPPGYYMLFLLNSQGVPSVAEFVQVN